MRCANLSFAGAPTLENHATSQPFLHFHTYRTFINCCTDAARMVEDPVRLGHRETATDIWWLTDRSQRRLISRGGLALSAKVDLPGGPRVVHFKSLDQYLAVMSAAAEARPQLLKYSHMKTVRDALKNGRLRRGSRVPVEKDPLWHLQHKHLLLEALRAKFHLHSQQVDRRARQVLLDTHPKRIHDGNIWHENYWGVCLCDSCSARLGQNVYGQALMQVRDEALQGVI